jgi:hypothetical protein
VLALARSRREAAEALKRQKPHWDRPVTPEKATPTSPMQSPLLPHASRAHVSRLTGVSGSELDATAAASPSPYPAQSSPLSVLPPQRSHSHRGVGERPRSPHDSPVLRKRPATPSRDGAATSGFGARHRQPPQGGTSSRGVIAQVEPPTDSSPMMGTNGTRTPSTYSHHPSPAYVLYLAVVAYDGDGVRGSHRALTVTVGLSAAAAAAAQGEAHSEAHRQTVEKYLLLASARRAHHSPMHSSLSKSAVTGELCSETDRRDTGDDTPTDKPI